MKTFTELAYAELHDRLAGATNELGRQPAEPGKDRRASFTIGLRELPLELQGRYAMSTTVAAHMRAWGIGTRVEYVTVDGRAGYEIHLFMPGDV